MSMIFACRRSGLCDEAEIVCEKNFKVGDCFQDLVSTFSWSLCETVQYLGMWTENMNQCLYHHLDCLQSRYAYVCHDLKWACCEFTHDLLVGFYII